jgi:predicted lipoprotein with Yx(FWY)xxD motif
MDKSKKGGTTMKTLIKSFVVLFVLLAFVAAGAALAGHHAVKVATKEGLGSYLTDTEGKTLYYFKKDSTGKSACEGPCVDKWPLYFRDTVEPKGQLKAEDFGTITRADGKKQTSYKGMPLYYFFKDAKAGDTAGHGVNDVWFVVNP